MGELYKVVSVEDDAALFNLISVSLKPLPIELHHANNGTEALELIPRIQADLIILDINLPDIHGWDVLKRLLAMQQTFKGVIVLTAHTGPTHRVIAHLQEVTAYIPKPFNPLELRRTVSDTLGITTPVNNNPT